MNYRMIFAVIAITLSMFSFISCDAEVVSLELPVDAYDYGTVNLDDSDTHFFRINNGTEFTIKVNELSMIGVGSSDFSIISGQNTPIIMASGRSIILEVEFKPTREGLRQTNLLIKHTGKGTYSRIYLKGYGKAIPKIEIPESSYDFYKVYYNTTETHDFEVFNPGTAIMSITDFKFSGIHEGLYSISAGGDLPIRIDPDSSHVFTVAFSPVAAGHFPIRLDISHTAENARSPYGIYLTSSVTNFAPDIELDKTDPWNLGQFPTTFPGLQPLEIRSIGKDPLTISDIDLKTNTVYSIANIIDSSGNTVTLPHTVNPSDSIYAIIRFRPSSNIVYTDELVIEHDSYIQSSPLTLNLKGNGRTSTSKNFDYSGVITNFTVPPNVHTIRIEAFGAQGGGALGGYGARVRGDFIVSPGEVIRIIVGETGHVTAQGLGYAAGGGGGTFVYRNASDPFPMIAAAGGGGQAEYGSLNTVSGGTGSYTSTTTNGSGSGSGTGGSNGNGGDGGQNVGNYSTAGGGCGWLTDGKDGQMIRNPEGEGGKCPKNGAKGGEFTHPTAAYCAGTAGDGGFGGGGSMSEDTGAGGGGGGFNGGGGGNNDSATSSWGSGGGGGSYNGGYYQSGSSGNNIGDGKVVISY